MDRRSVYAATWSHVCELNGLGGPMLQATQQGCGCLSCKGCVSLSNPNMGLWFIKALDEVFQNDCDGSHDILTLLTKVNHIIVEKVVKLNASDKEMNHKTQFPSIVSMFRKQLYLPSRLSLRAALKENDQCHVAAKNELHAAGMLVKQPQQQLTYQDEIPTNPRHSLQTHRIATASASRAYKMNHHSRGVFVIINNRYFKKQTGMGERAGTDADAANLYQLFMGLGFDVRLEQNKTSVDMLRLLDGGPQTCCDWPQTL
ncbi:hypothetical protein LSAT2_027950 [Lamellibrachia satsuma]|nr:hypothetical protein LSAT2_027950 [Lamellibrachia satsuma]